jgi:hypothetical protein
MSVREKCSSSDFCRCLPMRSCSDSRNIISSFTASAPAISYKMFLYSHKISRNVSPAAATVSESTWALWNLTDLFSDLCMGTSVLHIILQTSATSLYSQCPDSRVPNSELESIRSGAVAARLEMLLRQIPGGTEETNRIVSGPAEIRTGHFPNTSTEHCRYGNPLDGKVWCQPLRAQPSYFLKLEERERRQWAGGGQLERLHFTEEKKHFRLWRFPGCARSSWQSTNRLQRG